MTVRSAITFDFYGTLVQWHETLEIAFREMLVRRGLPASGTAPLLSDFAAEGRRLRDAPPWKRYRQVLHDASSSHCNEPDSRRRLSTPMTSSRVSRVSRCIRTCRRRWPS